MNNEEVGAAMASDARSTTKNGARDGRLSEVCTVCDSVDQALKFEHTFQGVPHRFCSERCLRRFTEHPHLYVGSPQYGLSLKQQGKSIVKTHTIALAHCSDSVLRQKLLDHLQGLAGIKSCDVKGEEVTVSYDLVRISLRDIEQEVQRLAGALKDSLAAKMTRRALHFGEECELDNLAHLSNSGKQYGF